MILMVLDWSSTRIWSHEVPLYSLVDSLVKAELYIWAVLCCNFCVIFQAPEMICSMKYDASVDLWSVGVILYGTYGTFPENKINTISVLINLKGSVEKRWHEWQLSL